MGELIQSSGNSLTILLQGHNGGLAVPMPFERDIFLLGTYVAGTSYVEGIEELEPFLNVGDKLDFFREPENEFDDRAIVIKNADGVKIGYVPKLKNEVFSRLMDAGKLIFGRITKKEMKGTWLKIDIDIFMHE